MRTFVDTNVLVYLFDSGAPQKQARAREVVGALARDGALALSSQVLSELFVTVTRKLEQPLPVTRALRALDDLSAFPCVASTKRWCAAPPRARPRTSSRSGTPSSSRRPSRRVRTSCAPRTSSAGRVYQGVRVEDPFAEV